MSALGERGILLDIDLYSGDDDAPRGATSAKRTQLPRLERLVQHLDRVWPDTDPGRSLEVAADQTLDRAECVGHN
jgi:hypothetical protein